MSAWDKFAFITAVGADSRLTVGARFVLMQIALNWTAVDRPTFHVKQATIAERLGVSLRLVKAAIADGRRHGYIVVELHRKRGTGQHGADMNRMMLPELSAQSAPHSELGARNDGVGCTNGQSEVHESTELGARANPPTRENTVPNCSLNALDKALEGLPTRASAEPPPKTCTKHARWDGPACGSCGDDKRAYQGWLTASRQLLAHLDYQRDRATGTEAAAISDERRKRIAIFQHLGEQWK
jgi:hypothetical protein